MARDFIRLATYNVEWFNSLFDDQNRLLEDEAPSSRYGITRADQIAALGAVFQAMDADGIMIIEAPDTRAPRSTLAALSAFAQRFNLRQTAVAYGFSSDTQQEIAFLYDPRRIKARHDPRGAAVKSKFAKVAPRFDTSFTYDLNDDGHKEQIRFSKPPLELSLRLPNHHRLRLIGVHAKSKNPHGARDERQAVRISIENRRKQIAQCLWLRARAEEHLKRGENLIVLGDFNDGPGLDEFEKLFGKSGVEIVLDSENPSPELRLYDPHAAMALSNRLGFAPTSSRFYLPQQKRYFEALLDFIMVSLSIGRRAPNWRIWHPFCDPALQKAPSLQEALLMASDHFPVSIDIPLHPAPESAPPNSSS